MLDALFASQPPSQVCGRSMPGLMKDKGHCDAIIFAIRHTAIQDINLQAK